MTKRFHVFWLPALCTGWHFGGRVQLSKATSYIALYLGKWDTSIEWW